MSRRNYNVFFNTHTVSGIVISVALYIMFFAGAFALFKDEIKIWEEGKALSHTERKDIDFDKIFNKLHDTYDLTGRDLQINFGEQEDEIYVFLSESRDSLTLQKDKESHYFAANIHTQELKTYKQQYSLGDFLYRLHYFAQIPDLGIYIAGFVSFFFLFAIVTGVIVHWKKIVPNFYQFNPKIALKRVWTDAHTALGIIGLPFQFIFAVSGAYFCLSLLVLLPAGLLYNGDQDRLIADMRPDRKEYAWEGKSETEVPSFNYFAKDAASQWENYQLTRAFVRNYQGTNMKYFIMGELPTDKRFIGTGSIVYDAYTGKKESVKDPYKLSYLEDVQFVYGRLHYGDFGGIIVLFIYFILALVTCFVILTGVLIWIEARNKKNMTISQRLFTAKVGHIYLAMCLSMLPVTALSFLFVKFAHGYFDNKLSAIYWFYFLSWLAFTLYYRFKRDNYFVNKNSLLLGAILGFSIPIANGIVSGNWIWATYTQGQFEILYIDLLWLGIASASLLAYLKIKPAVKASSTFTKHPIDYNNISALKTAAAASITEPSTTTTKQNDQNHIPMRTKIVFLWFFLAFSWLVHHIYGLFNIYYNETLMIEGATGAAPMEHHLYRILFEGICLLFALLSIEVSKTWFRWLSLIWASVAGLYNVYHLIAALLHEPSNLSEIFMLLLTVVASVFLVINLNKWRKLPKN